MKKIIAALGALVVMSPSLTAAYSITTPYWCGWGYSLTPCAGYTVQPYGYPQSYQYSYTYSYPYNYSYPCTPLSYDSYGRVTQTSCGYTNVSYPYQYQYSYQSYPYDYYGYQNYNHQYQSHSWHDRDWDRGDRDHDRDHDWDGHDRH
jgi:hypothetical protein